MVDEFGVHRWGVRAGVHHLSRPFVLPMVAVAFAAIPFLKAPSRCFHSCRLAPGKNLIFADRAVAAFGSTAFEAWSRCGPVHLFIVCRWGGVSGTFVFCLGCVRCVVFGISNVFDDGCIII